MVRWIYGAFVAGHGSKMGGEEATDGPGVGFLTHLLNMLDSSGTCLLPFGDREVYPPKQRA